MDKAYQSAFLLHHRPFRDSSVIAEFFTIEWGRVPAVVKAARGSSTRMRQMAANMQPFQQLQVSLSGKGELKTLISVESEKTFNLQGRNLFAALYLNELTLRLLHRLDPYPDLWLLYRASLQRLSVSPALESVLRVYELGLLQQLGYGVVFDVDASSGESIHADEAYCFEAERGFIKQTGLALYAGQATIAGRDLLSLSQGAKSAAGEWTASELRILKRICRQALAPLLGSKPLKSRELFSGKAS